MRLGLTRSFQVLLFLFPSISLAAAESPPPMVEIGPHGRLEYSEDTNGNRIPDFSNAGYMGGGVEIPDVQTKLALSPHSTGDDTERIQAAINWLATLPRGEDGFRGAILLRAGEFRVSGTLHISASGIVLRGEGDGPGGTVLRATGTSQRRLIEIKGSGRATEIGGTRRAVTDEYVPVGARRFHVASTSGYEVGDAIIVHRPSTAEWISEIGMDEIPPRSDGGTVHQWEPGRYDLFYDRIITAIDGNRITVDAPLANALESRFGGGSIYRYTFPGRISQVGVEFIRSVSDFAGESWTPKSYDEEHAWMFIEFDAVQNGWVRNTTTLHYGFGNTFINRRGKWITIQDSQNLQPVSQIKGGRRYPFYVAGQLNLVQRCYANYARHDFGTSSLTHGPNVFLWSRADSSYSDTGPHQRWATGALYDNISIPNKDIVVQNRLNLGSGHGWAGANHVLWNSTARRICAQNPPTAQNWSIGSIGQKWAGTFPSYATDGYWVSHGTQIEPQSLYLKQLEDRLAPAGEGGMITTVQFGPGAGGTVTAGEVLELPLERRGNGDGSIRVSAQFHGDGAELFEPVEDFIIPAFTTGASLPIRLRDDAVWENQKTLSIRLVHTAQYSVGSAAVAELTVSFDPRAEWRQEHFSESELADPAISGDEADPAGDGVSNLMKYALNLSPFARATAADLPGSSIEAGYLTLTFARGSSRTDIDYLVEVSGDLAEWKSGPDFTEEISASGQGEWQEVTVRDRTPLATADRRFIRLKIGEP